jgi:hypothetical protein
MHGFMLVCVLSQSLPVFVFPDSRSGALKIGDEHRDTTMEETDKLPPDKVWILHCPYTYIRTVVLSEHIILDPYKVKLNKIVFCTYQQCFGSGFIESGSRYFAESGSVSRLLLNPYPIRIQAEVLYDTNICL